MQTKIRVRAGSQSAMFQPTTPFTEVEVDTDASTVEAVDAVVKSAQDAALLLAETFCPLAELETIKEKPEAETPAREPEDEDLSGVADEQLERSNRRMYDAIGSAVENIHDIAKELQDEETPPGEERVKVLGRTLNTIADSLGSSRV